MTNLEGHINGDECGEMVHDDLGRRVRYLIVKPSRTGWRYCVWQRYLVEPYRHAARAVGLHAHLPRA